MRVAWKKKLINAGWLAIAVSGIMLLGAGAGKKSKKICTGINVELTGTEDHFFVEEKELEKLLNANGKLEGRSLEQINLMVMEHRLENDKWIRNAELFFDNNQVLQVLVEEREPVARIFTIGGYSYYIDSSCQKLPLSDKLSARVPMFTNFPSDRTRLGRVDSTLMVELKNMALYINSVPFWKAQVAQVNINDARDLELVPTVGNHIVMMGKVENYEEEFNRLYTFYKQVWTKVGLEKYDKIDVQFNGQVVATKRGTSGSKIDSAAARKVLEDLLVKKTTGAETDAIYNVPKDKIRSKPVITTMDQAEGVADLASKKEKIPATAKQVVKQRGISKEEKKTERIAPLKLQEEKAVENRVPKAVMKKRTDN